MVALKTNTGKVREYQTLGEMMKSQGAPIKDIDLARSTRLGYFVYVRGALVGEAKIIAPAGKNGAPKILVQTL